MRNNTEKNKAHLVKTESIFRALKCTFIDSPTALRKIKSLHFTAVHKKYINRTVKQKSRKNGLNFCLLLLLSCPGDSVFAPVDINPKTWYDR